MTSNKLESYGRIDLMKVQTMQRNCLKFFSRGKKTQQKVILGDDSGTIQSFSVNKGYVTNNFKTLPREKRISSVAVSKDKAFFSSNRIVRGITKKGKEYYKLDTSVPDDIVNLSAHAPNIYATGEYIMYQYCDSVEQSFFMSPDRINAMTSFNALDPTVEDAVLGCNDRIIRIVRNSNILLEVVVEGATSSLSPYAVEQDRLSKQTLLYGTENGVLANLQLGEDSVKKLWDVSGRHSIQLITPASLSMSGEDDILVGRDNGLIQVYTFDSSPVPRLAFERNVEESITGLEAGFLTNSNERDIVISTYSGRVMAYTHESTDADGLNSIFPETATKLALKLSKKLHNSNNQKVVGVSYQEKMNALAKDIDKIDQKLTEVKTKYNRLSSDMVAVHCKYSLKSKFTLDSESACYRLTIELDISIDSISLYCESPMDIVELETPNFAVSDNAQIEPVSEKKDRYFIVVFRATESVKRFEVLLRSAEGQYGTMEAFITPKLTPKIAKVETFQIKPLSLHERLHELNEESEKRPMNTLNITGAFTLSEVHSWIATCLEGIPDKITKEEVSYFFKSTFQDTVLIVKCKKGEAVFKSDNLSSIAVLDEVITKEATERKKRVNTTFKMEDETFANVLKLLYPKIEYQLQLSEKIKLIEPLKELQMQEEDLSFISSEYKWILDNSQRLVEEHTQQKTRLNFLHDIILKLCSDRYKFKRQNPQQKLEQLKRLLQTREYDLWSLTQFFSA